MSFRLSKIKVILYGEVQIVQNNIINLILAHVEVFMLFKKSSLSKDMFINFREGARTTGRETEKERERNINVREKH